MALQLITPAEDAAVSTEVAKAHLRVDSASENELIDRLIKAATRTFELMAGISLCQQTWKLYLDGFSSGQQAAARSRDSEVLQSGAPSDIIRLPNGPVSAVSNVKYYDENGTLQTLSSSGYVTDLVSRPARLMPAVGASWPSTQCRVNAVQIEYVAGQAFIWDIDPRAVQAVLLLVGHWYENREAVLTGTISKEIEHALKALAMQLWDGNLN